MMKRIITVTLACIAASVIASAAPKARWSAEKANAWAADKGWIVGCDYVTSNAINQIEMWQAETFSPELIDRELGYAESIGFNTVRVFFSHLVYFDNPREFKKRFSQFLDICEKHHIRALPTFWTNGGKCKDPKLGPQPPSRKGVHNSEWCMVPGTEWVNDTSTWPRLERMVKDILRTYRNDKRILMWCLYNEPENHRRGVKSSVPLMTATFKWAREVNPSQPLTAPVMRPIGDVHGNSLPEVSFVLENSDVISFHCYRTPEVTEKFIKTLLPYGRPLICTEYMARTLGSTFEGCMPIFKKYNVGAINFGLVTGKLNCHYHWNKTKDGVEIPWDKEPEVWFHDIFREDGTPFSEAEIAFIKSQTGAK